MPDPATPVAFAEGKAAAQTSFRDSITAAAKIDAASGFAAKPEARGGVPVEVEPKVKPAAEVVPVAKPAEEEPKPAEPAAPKFDLLKKIRDGSLTPEEAAAAKKPNPAALAPTEEGTKAAVRWSEVQKELKAEKAERERLVKELEEAKKSAPTDYAEIKKQLEDHKLRLAQQDLRESDDYKRDVVEPLDRLYAEVKTDTEAAGLDWKAMVTALEITDKVARNRAIHAVLQSKKADLARKVQAGEMTEEEAAEADIDLPTIADITSNASMIHQHLKYGAELLKNAPKVQESMKAERDKAETAKQQQARAEFEKARDMMFALVQDEIPLLKDEKLAAAALDATNTKWEDLKPGAKAWTLMAGELLEPANEQIKTHEATIALKDTEIEKLKKQLAKLAGANPNSNGAPPAKATNGEATGSFRENLAHAAGIPLR